MTIKTKTQVLMEEYQTALEERDWVKIATSGVRLFNIQHSTNLKNFPGQLEYREVVFDISKLDSWSLKESVNILCHCLPSRPESVPEHDGLNKQIMNTKLLILRAVGVSLFPANPNDKEDDYRFIPQDIVEWAKEKEMILPLSLLEIFESNGDKKIHPNTFINMEKREEVFAVAFALLAEYRDQCVAKSSGKVMLNRLLNLMEQKADEFWPEEGVPPLQRSTIEKYLGQWLTKVKKSKK